MGIYRRPDSPFFWWSHSEDGHRFRGCCGTASRPDAVLVFRRERDRLRTERGRRRRGEKPELTLDQALTRYADEHAIRLASARDIAHIGELLIGGIGGDMLLSQLAAGDVATYVARRRAHVADASVNRELTIFRAVLRMAALRWGAAVAEIDWKRQFLIEPAPRARTLSDAEEARLFAALRPDFHGIVRFALLTGMRLANLRGLKWRQIDEAAGVILLAVKSRRPGGDAHVVPLTRAMLAVLSAERGRHPEFVFTYLAQRARSAAGRERERVSGRRCPFTKSGWRKSWRAALGAAGIDGFRFHDLRHTAATRLYRRTRDLALVKKLLGHRALETTLRYENSDTADLAAALEALDPATPRRRRAE